MRLLQFGCCLSFPLLLFLVFHKTKATFAKFNDDLMVNPNSSPVLSRANELEGRLVFAHVIFRHGDRTPIEPYKTDPWKSRDFWSTGWGQLTNIGKVQQFQLGQWLRQRYDSLLGPSYSNEKIYIRSTDVDRTLMSALSNLAGLYPPEGNDVWNSSIKWQPIPVHTLAEESDVLLGKAPCTSYQYALDEVLSSPEFDEINERYEYLYNYLTKYTGQRVQSLDAVQRINNTLFIEEIHNKTLPDWTKRVYPSSDMTYISDFYFTVATYTRRLARLKAGPLIKEILERFEHKAEGKLNPDRNVWIYSGHDTNIANVLNALKLYDMRSPDYASCILFEMRLDDENEAYISIFHKKNLDDNDPEPLEIPNCGIACPLKDMFDLYKDIIPIDWDEECKLSTLLMTYEEANLSLAMGILVAVISVMLILSYLAMLYYRRRSYRNSFSYSQRFKDKPTKENASHKPEENDEAASEKAYQRKVHRTLESK